MLPFSIQARLVGVLDKAATLEQHDEDDLEGLVALALTYQHGVRPVQVEQLLAEDVDVTARGAARRHSTLKNASAFLRNAQRKAFIEAAQQQQRDARAVHQSPAARRNTPVAERLARRTAEKEACSGKSKAS